MTNGGTRYVGVQWVKIKSWHIVWQTWGKASVARCGKPAWGDRVDILPEGKTCETCLALAERDREKQQ